MSVLADYDLNIFYPQYVDPVSGEEEFLPTIVIAVTEYHNFEGVTFCTETPYRFLLTAKETAQLQKDMPEEEFDKDWWESAEVFVARPHCPKRVKKVLLQLPPVKETPAWLKWLA